MKGITMVKKSLSFILFLSLFSFFQGSLEATKNFPKDFDGDLDVPMLKSIFSGAVGYNKNLSYPYTACLEGQEGQLFQYQARRLKEGSQIPQSPLIELIETIASNPLATEWHYRLSDLDKPDADPFLFVISRLKVQEAKTMDPTSAEHFTRTFKHSKKVEKHQRPPSNVLGDEQEDFLKKLKLMSLLDNEVLAPGHLDKALKKSTKEKDKQEKKKKAKTEASSSSTPPRARVYVRSKSEKDLSKSVVKELMKKEKKK